MFSVPGWNIGSKRPIPEQPPPAKQRKQPKDDGSNKRKRIESGKSLARKINGNELEKLWDEQFGDHDQKKSKKRVQEKHRTSSQVIPADGQAPSHASKEKPRKSLPSTDGSSSKPKSSDINNRKSKQHDGELLSNTQSSSPPSSSPPTLLPPP